jgi:hypothetical protein
MRAILCGRGGGAGVTRPRLRRYATANVTVTLAWISDSPASTGVESLAAAFAMLAILPLAAIVYGVTHLLFYYEDWVIGARFADIEQERLPRLILNSSEIFMGSCVFVFAYVFQTVASCRLCRTIPNEDKKDEPLW